MLGLFALVLAGFSVGAALLLLLALFTIYRNAELTPLSRCSGAVLMLGLAALQALHIPYLLSSGPEFLPRYYLALLFVVASAFYLFFRGALLPRDERWLPGALWYSPVLLAFWLPADVALPTAFVSGGLYASLLVRMALRLQGQRKRYRLEAGAFLVHGIMALMVLGLGIAAPWLGHEHYVSTYSILIGIGYAFSLFMLLWIPDLAANAADAVRSAYAKSTLGSVNVDAVVQKLQHLMTEEQVYTNESLSLGSLAELLELSPQQLSELINTRFAMGFPRYVREHRIRAAQRMLIEEPQASVLSVGMAVGFNSQSNFYAAFREITGEVPGRYRRQVSGTRQG